MANPGKEHWKAVQWIFRYLRGTSNACLKFGKTGEGLAGYVDSDFAADLDKRRSLTGYVFTISGCAVCRSNTIGGTIQTLTISKTGPTLLIPVNLDFKIVRCTIKIVILIERTCLLGDITGHKSYIVGFQHISSYMRKNPVLFI